MVKTRHGRIGGRTRGALALMAAGLCLSSGRAQEISATHAAPGYKTPGTSTITGVFQNQSATSLRALLWRPVLPSGWAIESVAGEGSPELRSGEIVFTAFNLTNTITFTYTVSVPAGVTGTQTVADAVEYTLEGMVNPAAMQALPNPLVLGRLQELRVESDFGSAFPPIGVSMLPYGTTTAVRITNSPVGMGTTQFVCRGWSGTGSAPAGGVGTNTGPFSLTADSTVRWNWSTNVWLSGSATGSGVVQPDGGWLALGTTAVVTARASIGAAFAGWTGDVPAIDTNNNPLALAMDRARSVTARFVPRPRVDAITPADGSNGVARGSTVTAHFSTNVAPASLSASSFFLHSGNGIYALTPTLDGSNRTATLPAPPFTRAGEVVFATLTEGVRAADGLRVVPRNWQFRVDATNGTGAFAAAPGLANETSVDSALGDLDGDGDLDAWIANRGAQPCRVYTNDGVGNLSDSGQSLGSGGNWGVALGDLDRDGDLDALVANDAASRVYLNDGAGHFTDSGQALTAGQSRSVALGDFNGDGALDAFFANEFGPCRVYTNNGAGVFGDTGQRLGNTRSWSVALGDLNRDGFLDAYVANTGPDAVYTNDGFGTFTDSGQILDSADGRDVEMGDLNGDGALDVFVANIGANVVYTNDGAGHLTDSGRAAGDGSSFGVTLGDFNGDRRLDAFVARYSQPSLVLLNTGAASFTATSQSLGRDRGWRPAAGDVNGDGAIDVIVPHDGQPGAVWINQIVPGAPTANLATNVTAYAFDACWLPTPRAVGYALDVATNSAFGPSDLLPGYGNLAVGASVTVTVTNLVPKTTYYYRVRASNLGGTSSNSQVVTVQTVLAPTIGTLPTSLAFGAARGEAVAANVFAITNSGGMAFSYTNTVVGAGSWLSILPTSGFLKPGEAHVHTAAVVTTGLPVGVYTATNWIASAEATNSPLAVAISLTVTNAMFPLTVNSLYGGSTPYSGTRDFVDGTLVTLAVTNSPAPGAAGVRNVCRGWVGTGSVPRNSGSTNTGPFAVTNASSLSWNWTTQFLLTASAGLNGRVTAPNGWFDSGSNATVSATASNGYHFAGWTGDVPGALTNNAVLGLSMDQPRTATARFDIDTADVRVSQAVTGGAPLAGSDLRYTITVTNAGPFVAQNVQATVTLPPLATARDPLTRVLGTMPVGGSVAYPFSLAVDPSAATPLALTNRVLVASDTPDPLSANNTAVLSTSIGAEADLALTKRVIGGSTTAGANLIYRLTVTNTGPSWARQVVVTDTLPSNMTSADPVVTNLGVVASGTAASYVFTVTIDPGATGRVTNRASVASATTDPSPANNAVEAVSVVGTEADLALGLRVSGGSGIAGEQVAFTFTVTNRGPSEAQNVRVTDYVPAGLTAQGPAVTNLGTIQAHGTASWTLATAIDGSTRGAVTNVGSVASDTLDPTPGNDSASAEALVTASADLEITKTIAGGTGIAGESLTYQIAVTNRGPSLARQVQVTDSLPAVLTTSDAVATNLGSLASGATASWTIQTAVSPAALGDVTNSAVVSSADPDPQVANNSALRSSTVAASADIGVAQSVVGGTGIAGQIMTYGITITNRGPSNARSVLARFTVSPGGTAVDSTLRILGIMQPGASTSFTFRARIQQDALGVVTNLATLTTSTADPQTSDNAMPLATPVTAQADLAIRKELTAGSLTAGDDLVYAITVTNAGPSMARALTITDELPPGTTSADAVVTNLAQLAAQGSLAYSLRVHTGLDQKGALTNRASLASTTPDPVATNNSSAVTTEIVPPLYSLVIASDFGTPSPARGTNIHDRNTTVDCALPDAPVTQVSTQFICTGWAGTGSAPAAGTTTNLTVTLVDPVTTLRWLWITNVWLDVSAGPNGDVVATNGWQPFGSAIAIRAVPQEGFQFDAWAGDVPAGAIHQNPLSVTMDRARTLTAAFTPVAPILYVDAGAGGSADGLSWASAFTNLQRALAVAVVSQEVWVAQGVYVPGTTRQDRFTLPARVPLYGGFTNGAVARGDRDWERHATVLSGDIGLPGVSGDNSYHVLAAAEGSTLDGFQIRGGRADGPGADASGAGGWFVSDGRGLASMAVNCVFADNTAVDGGGGLMVAGNSLYVSNCTFRANTAGTGGGLYLERQQGAYRLALADSAFIGNTATNGDGGGACITSSNVFATAGSITNCTFVANTAARHGGGVSLQRFARPVVSCRFLDNRSGEQGGAAYLARQARAVLEDCTLVGNRAGLGGALAMADGSPTLLRDLIAGNLAALPGGRGGAVYVSGSAGVDTAPSFLACTMADNLAEAANGGQTLAGAGASAASLRVTLIDTIAWHNGAGDATAVNPGAVTGDYSCVKGGLAGIANTGSDPLFLAARSGTWTGTAVYDAPRGCSQVPTDGAGWTPGELAGALLNPATAQPRLFLIASNSADSLTVWGDASGLVVSNGSFAVRDYHLASTNSPCVDGGIYIGYPYRGQAPDIGLYEWGFQANIRVVLEGPWNAGSGRMEPTLRATGAIPATSPYRAAPRTVAAVPTNAVDWVLLGLQAQPSARPFAAQSVFLGPGGEVLDDAGNPGVLVAAPPGEYYVRIQHRNHLAVMSSAPVPFANQAVAYDFSAAASRATGGTNAVVEVSAGIWAMAAGDADADGAVLAVDEAIAQTQAGRTGYSMADFDLDGQVATDEFAAHGAARAGRTSAAPEPETGLAPELNVSPAKLTLLAGGGALFRPVDASGSTHWAFVHNRSGSPSLPTVLTANQFPYFAGTNAGTVDVLETWDASNRLARTVINVLSTNDVAKAGKAIIIAGRKSANDPLWPTTDYLSGFAFNTLLYRGFSRDNTFFLNPEPGRDLDANGSADDVDGETTWANVANTFTNWAVSSAPLFIYLVDHGATDEQGGFMRLSATERLRADDLDNWLDAIQDACSNDVVVVLDFCQAGSFVPALDYEGAASRIVVAACGPEEPTYFVAGGLVSFSGSFFTGILLGYSVEQSFTLAADSVDTYQTASMADSQGAAADTFVGAMFVAGQDVPRIGRVVGIQSLRGQTVATIWADEILSTRPLTRVWCSVVPPDHAPADPANPVIDLVDLDLFYDPASGQYRATYNGFAKTGVYRLLFYAMDTRGGVSLPSSSFVLQGTLNEQVILVTGGETYFPEWDTANEIGNTAYRTFRARLFGNDQIDYFNSHLAQNLDGSPGNDVDGLPTLAALGAAITNRNHTVDTLTLYLVGSGTNNTLRLNEDETLNPDTLAGWLNAFQADNDRLVNLVMDFSGSGDFLGALANYDPSHDPASLGRRISIGSAAANRPSLMAHNGQISFSQFFLSGILNGASIGDSASDARRILRRASGELRQLAQIDDNENGIANEKDTDGVLSRSRFIGAAFVTGNDVPAIGRVMADSVLTNDAALTLWADDVTDVEGISNVWCLVTPPGYDASSELPRLPLLLNPDTGRHEGVYTGFVAEGTYTLTFLAEDTSGQVSDPLQSEVIRITRMPAAFEPDAFEVDDTAAQATPFVLGEAQVHTFHTPSDEDWVSFYAVSNFVYDIETVHNGTNVDTLVDLYRQMPDGVLTNVDSVDLFGVADGELAGLDFPANGYYFVRVRQYPAAEWTPGSYRLNIRIPVGGDVLVVVAVDKLASDHAPPGAVAILDGSKTRTFGSANSVSFAGISAGWHSVEVTTPAGYQAEEDPNTPAQVRNINSTLYGNPKRVHSSTPVSVFQFVPYGRAIGSVRDRDTGNWVSGARVSFTARSGIIAGYAFAAYPAFAAYGTPWQSQADGTFPTNVWLPTVGWNLTVSATGYATLVRDATIASLSAGEVRALGDLYLTPLDTNANGIADDWEIRYYGTNVVAAGADTDRDGASTWFEYRAGTDPTNATSVLALRLAKGITASGLQLTWPVSAGRAYAVQTAGDLVHGDWYSEAGPWTASQGIASMTWTQTNRLVTTGGYYRVGVILP